MTLNDLEQTFKVKDNIWIGEGTKKMGLRSTLSIAPTDPPPVHDILILAFSGRF